MVGIIYAVPRGGQREFNFMTGAELASHVQANHPGLFAGVPECNEKYSENMERICQRSYSIPQKREK